jgi:hypothetical protein
MLFSFYAAFHIAKQKTVSLLLEGFLLLVDTLLVGLLLEMFLPAHLLLPRTSRSVHVLLERHPFRRDSCLRAFILLPKS